jgi:hypothetical protein
MQQIGFAVVLAASILRGVPVAGAELPTDAGMIAHFTAHREEFETLVAL